jgi:predicted transcriptional regulator YheO
MRRQLDSYVPICEAIARLFSPHVEVVLHDLATRKIFYIANALSKRRAGDSSLNEPETAFNGIDEVIGPYAKMNWDGRRLKSISAVIRDRGRKRVGLLCINHDIAVLASTVEQLQQLLELPAPLAPTAPLISRDWREKVNTVIGDFLSIRKVTLTGLKSGDMDDLIGELAKHGIFDIRRAVPYLAAVLGLSRATVYNRLAALRERSAQPRSRHRRQQP